ncbi:hypothetical protein PUN28_012632 [Cardiocondyla obscurior]|uniref:Uncharacterized protein n=1 Tax=Cardiocondyla obscurior TaxID=286306 RepID=A0AAW2FEX4_9HYME
MRKSGNTRGMRRGGLFRPRHRMRNHVLSRCAFNAVSTSKIIAAIIITVRSQRAVNDAIRNAGGVTAKEKKPRPKEFY